MTTIGQARHSPRARLAWSSPSAGMLAVAAAAVAFCYGPVMTALVHQWRTNDIYAHGFLIPFIAGYLAWMLRGRLRALPLRPNFVLGVPALAASLALLVVADRAAVSVAAQLSVVTTTAALVLLVAGGAALRTLALPIAYLLFMIPIWETLTERLHLPFQLFSADAGAWLARSAGVPVYREGTLLMLPAVTLDVARECSGVNYLVAIAAIGIPLAWIGLTGAARRIGLVGIALTISVAANGLRVGLITLLSHQGIAGDVHGPWHVFQGLFVAMIGYAALMAGYHYLRRYEPRARAPADARPATEGRAWPFRRGEWALATAAALVAAAGLATRAEAKQMPLGRPLDALPASLGAWSLRTALDERPRFPTADQRLVRRYVRGGGAQVVLEIAYFESQRQGRELVSFATRDLERGGTLSTVPAAGERLRVVEKVEDLPRRELVSFWFDLSGRLATHRFRVKLITAGHSLLYGRTNGAGVLVIVPIRRGQTVEDARAVRDEFIAASWPALDALLAGPR